MAVKIIADARERNGAIPHLEASVSESNERWGTVSSKLGGGTVLYECKTITRGDYAWILNVGGKWQLAMVAERKTWKDLAASIPARCATQDEGLAELRRKGIYVFYIIEGSLGYKDEYSIGHMPFSSLHSKVRHNMLRGIPFIQVKDDAGTSDLLVKMARDLVKMHSTGQISLPWQFAPRTDVRTELQQLVQRYPDDPMTAAVKALIEGKTLIEGKALIEGKETAPAAIGDAVAENPADDQPPVIGGIETVVIPDLNPTVLPQELTVRASYTPNDLRLRAWHAFPGVSEKTATLLYTNLTIPIFFSMKAAEIISTISVLKYDTGVKIGDARAKRIASALTSLDCHIKILATVPGITEATARHILGLYSIQQLTSGGASETEICSIEIPGKKDNKRKLGRPVTVRLLQALSNQE
jgi:ERCC4-type nuclease